MWSNSSSTTTLRECQHMHAPRRRRSNSPLLLRHSQRLLNDLLGCDLGLLRPSSYLGVTPENVRKSLPHCINTIEGHAVHGENPSPLGLKLGVHCGQNSVDQRSLASAGRAGHIQRRGRLSVRLLREEADEERLDLLPFRRPTGELWRIVASWPEESPRTNMDGEKGSRRGRRWSCQRQMGQGRGRSSGCGRRLSEVAG